MQPAPLAGGRVAAVLSVSADEHAQAFARDQEVVDSHVIRSYGGAMQGFVGSYLEQSIKLFMSQQQQMRERVKSVVGVDPVGVVTGIAQKNYQRYK